MLRSGRRGNRARIVACETAQKQRRLRPCPASTAHRFDDSSWREVVEVAGGGGDGRVAELAGDDGDVDALGEELGADDRRGTCG